MGVTHTTSLWMIAWAYSGDSGQPCTWTTVRPDTGPTLQEKSVAAAKRVESMVVMLCALKRSGVVQESGVESLMCEKYQIPGGFQVSTWHTICRMAPYIILPGGRGL